MAKKKDKALQYNAIEMQGRGSKDKGKNIANISKDGGRRKYVSCSLAKNIIIWRNIISLDQMCNVRLANNMDMLRSYAIIKEDMCIKHIRYKQLM